MFFPVRDRHAEHEMVKDGELHIVDDVLGHPGLFGVAPAYMPQVDQHLGELLARPA